MKRIVFFKNGKPPEPIFGFPCIHIIFFGSALQDVITKRFCVRSFQENLTGAIVVKAQRELPIFSRIQDLAFQYIILCACSVLREIDDGNLFW